MDVAWLAPSLPPAPPLAQSVSAAKLHVLQLDPIKTRLGPRWPKLSALVHKLFQKALHRAQGPRDHYLPVGELSYIATFHGLTPDEAALACKAVAREVCELLFGEDLENVSVRSLIGEVPGPLMELSPETAAAIAARLEETGAATIVSRRASETVKKLQPDDWIAAAQDEARRLHHPMGFYPAWELARGKSQMLFLGLETKSKRRPAGVLKALGAGEAVRPLEIAALRAAAAYAARVEATGQVCAINVGVSCDTLFALPARMAYIKALKAVKIPPSSPLFLTIEQIPPGIPLGRLGELAGMLARPGLRLLLEFQQVRAVPQLNIRLGITGIGAALSENYGKEEAGMLAALLRVRAREQRACTFLHGLDTPELVEVAISADIKFGSGFGFGPRKPLDGLAEIPTLPLYLTVS